MSSGDALKEKTVKWRNWAGFIFFFIKVNSTIFGEFSSCETEQSLNSQVGWKKRYIQRPHHFTAKKNNVPYNVYLKSSQSIFRILKIFFNFYSPFILWLKSEVCFEYDLSSCWWIWAPCKEKNIAERAISKQEVSVDLQMFPPSSKGPCSIGKRNKRNS